MTEGDGSNKTIFTFSVDRITVDPSCDSPDQRAPDAHNIELVVELTTAAGLSSADLSLVRTLFDPYSFQANTTDGIPHEAESNTCALDKDRPASYASASKYHFTVTFGIDIVPTEIVLAGVGDYGTQGWVWKVDGSV